MNTRLALCLFCALSPAVDCVAAIGPFFPASLPYSPFGSPNDGRAAWVDFDGDGDIDISLNGQQGSKLFSVWLKDGAGLTAQPTNIPGEWISQDAHTHLTWADYNRDGKPDLARQFRGPFCNNNLCGGNMHGDRCEAWRNDGDGNFVSVFSSPGGAYGDIEWTDQNLDGYADFAFTGYWMEYPGYPRTAYGLVLGSANALNGYGDFRWPLSEGTFAWLDYDRDGLTDIAYTGNQRTEFSYSYSRSQLWHRTSSNWEQVPISPVPHYSAEVTWADIDLDGMPDLITKGSSGWDIWRQTASGFVRMTEVFPDALATVWGDLDNDGDLDCALCGATQAIIYENKGSFTFASGVSIAAQDRLGFADWDRDGDLDILTSTGAVYVNGNNTPARSPVFRKIMRRPDSVYLAFQAHPMTTFIVQWSDTGSGAWTSVTARPLEMQPGEFVFVDRGTPPVKRFYRLAVP